MFDIMLHKMLFIKNSYLNEFETKVKHVENNSVILEQTVFYAKSGGQPGDTGKIIFNEKTINIVDTIYDRFIFRYNIIGCIFLT